MTGGRDPSPTIRVRHARDVASAPLGEAGSQQVLLGGPREDASPLLMGLTMIRPGHTSSLIQHDTAEIGYVLTGTGSILTDSSEHAFGPGDALLIEQGCWHAIRADEDPVQMLYVFPSPMVPATRQHPAAGAP